MPLWWISLEAISSTTEINLLQPPNLALQQMGGGLWSVEAILCMAAMACPGVTSPAASRAVPWPSHWAGMQLSGWEMQTHTHTPGFNTDIHKTHLPSLGKSKKFSFSLPIGLSGMCYCAGQQQQWSSWQTNDQCAQLNKNVKCPKFELSWLQMSDREWKIVKVLWRFFCPLTDFLFFLFWEKHQTKTTSKISFCHDVCLLMDPNASVLRCQEVLKV